MSKATDKLNAIQVWSNPEPKPSPIAALNAVDTVEYLRWIDSGWCDPKPTVKTKPKPTRKPRK